MYWRESGFARAARRTRSSTAMRPYASVDGHGEVGRGMRVSVSFPWSRCAKRGLRAYLAIALLLRQAVKPRY